jgi:hypothetical protein
MDPFLERVMHRQVRLERELLVWRVLFTIVAAGAVLAAASPQAQKEIRLASADGKNTVVLSVDGLSLQSVGRRLAELKFETVGDGSKQLALLKLNGEVHVESGIISVGSPLKQRAAIRPDGFSVNLKLTDFVAEALSRPCDTSVNFRLDCRLIRGTAFAKVGDCLFAGPTFGVNAGINDKADRAQQLQI